jgi:hypothetical protein
MRPTKHDWAKLDPLIARLMAEGWSEQAACKEVGITRTTYRSHREALEGTPDTAAVQAPVQTRDTDAEPRAVSRADTRVDEPRRAVQRPVQPTDTSVDTGAEQSAVSSADTRVDEPRRAVQRPVQPTDTSVETGAEQSAEQMNHSRAETSAEDTPVHDAVQRRDTAPVSTPVQIPVQRFEQLEGQVQALAHAVRSIMERMNHTPVHEPAQITTLPPYPKAKADR